MEWREPFRKQSKELSAILTDLNTTTSSSYITAAIVILQQPLAIGYPHSFEVMLASETARPVTECDTTPRPVAKKMSRELLASDPVVRRPGRGDQVA